MIDISGASGRLKAVYTHLTSYLSSTRCAKIDNLDTTMSSRAPASTAVSNADYTPARGALLERLNATPGIPGTVKSIQSGVFYNSTGTLAGTGEDARYVDVTIAAVTVAKSVVLIQPMEAPTYGFVGNTARLLSTTSLRLSDNSSNSNWVGMRWTVVEFY